MKKILLLILLFITCTARAQFNCNNWSNYDRIFNFKAGVPFNASADVGYQWSQVGAFVGVKTFSKIKQVKGYPDEDDDALYPYLKINLVLFRIRSFQCIAEIFGCSKKFYGSDIKFDYWITDDVAVIFSPEYSNQYKQLNAGVAFRF